MRYTHMAMVSIFFRVNGDWCRLFILNIQFIWPIFLPRFRSVHKGKFETVGSLAVSTLLIGGALGIGWHSFELMMNVVQATGVNETASAAVAIVVDPSTSPVAPSTAKEIASVTDHHGHTLNPNAAWFALVSIVVKEWLYRASKSLLSNPLVF